MDQERSPPIPHPLLLDGYTKSIPAHRACSWAVTLVAGQSHQSASCSGRALCRLRRTLLFQSLSHSCRLSGAALLLPDDRAG